MKLTLLLTIACIFKVSASSYAQSLNVNLKDVSLKQVFAVLKKQSNYDFVYDSETLKNSKNVTVAAKNASIKEILDKCFVNQPFTYLIYGQSIIVTVKPSPVPIVSTSRAADIIITGVVTDSKQEPIPGVTVKVKTSSVAVGTKTDGGFSIKVPDEQAILVFSSIGYQTQEVLVGNKKVLSVVLNENIQTLEAVKIFDLGYGREKRSDLTGAIGSVNVEDLQKAPVRSFEEALAGRVAGVQVISADGQPGDSFNITIRGSSSVNNSNSPLYVIDGLAIENPDNNNINPAEIASITILKDASSTAIYGSRASNGVIIITTKKGKIGVPVVSYNGYYGNSVVNSRVKLMNAYDFVKLQNDLNPVFTTNNYFNDANGTPVRTLESYRNAQTLDFQNVLYQPAPFNNHFLSVSGGSEKTRYSISGGYTGQNGIITNSGFKRAQGRLNIEQTVSDHFKIGANLNYAATHSYGTFPRMQEDRYNLANGVTNNLIYRVWSYRPVTSSLDDSNLLNNLFDTDQGSGTDAPNKVNPAISALNEYNARFGNNFSATTYGIYTFNKAFSYRVNAGVNIQMNHNEIFNNQNTNSGSNGSYGPNGSISNSQGNDYSLDNILTYTKQFNQRNSLTVIGLVSQQWQHTLGSSFSALQVLLPELGVNGLSSGTVQPTVVTNSSDANLLGIGGTANYSYMNKYVFKVSFRADGSSKFAPTNRWGYFPSGGFAWKIGDEPFMKQQTAVSNLKLRINYGLTGNNRVSDFAYVSPITHTNTSGNIFGNNYQLGYFPSSLGNKDLRWETTAQFDAGLEFGIIKNLVTIEADYYRKDTKNLLLNAIFPTSSGFSSGLINVGKTRNQGFELTINTNNIRTKNFSWSSNFNISFNKNLLLALTDGSENILSIAGGIETTSNYIARVGQPLGSFYGYTYAGVYQYTDFNKLPNGAYVLKDNVIAPNGGLLGATRSTVQPGDPKYTDINGDGQITNEDQGIIGNANPKAIGGFNNDFTYKGFDLNVFIQWSYGGENLNANRFYLERPTQVGNNQFASYNDRWTPTNPSNYAPRVSANSANLWSTRFIEDASFARLKTVQLGYSLPSAFLTKIGVKTCRVYASGQNLFKITNYSGPDPEANVAGFGLTPGFDFSAYPRALTYTFGINLTF